MEDRSSTRPSPARSRPSVFKNRPAWAIKNTSKVGGDDTADLFNRQNDSLAKFRQDGFNRQKTKATPSGKSSTGHLEGQRPVKKRRVSEEAGSSTDDDDSSGSKPKVPLTKKRFTFTREMYISPTKEASRRLEDDNTKIERQDGPVVIDLEDDLPQKKKLHDRDCKDVTTSPRKETTVDDVPVNPEKDLDSDEEMSMLAQRARERQLKAQNQENNSFQAIEGVEIASPEQSKANTGSTPGPRHSPTDSADPVLKILVHSEMPKTVPLIVQRKLSQRLKEVKTAWCTKNNIGEDEAFSISLHWRGRKLYESSTCKTLGLDVNSTGELFFKGHEQDAGPENACLEMEAMTAKMFMDRKNSKDQEKVSDENVPPLDQEKPEAGIKVVLKGQGYADYKLIVRSHTPISQLVKVFRSKRDVPSDKQVFLMFDGEKLNMDDVIENTELADLDTIEVHVR